MKKDIKYTGYTATPSDYECQDGELDVALNLVNEDGEMVAVEGGTEVATLADDEELLLIHVVNNGQKNYIIKNVEGEGSAKSYNLCYKTSLEERAQATTIAQYDTDFKVSKNGNLLAVFGIGRMEHWLYKEGAYKAYKTDDFGVSVLFSLGVEDGDVERVNGSDTPIENLINTTVNENNSYIHEYDNEVTYDFGKISQDKRTSMLGEDVYALTLNSVNLEANTTYRLRLIADKVTKGTTHIMLYTNYNCEGDPAATEEISFNNATLVTIGQNAIHSAEVLIPYVTAGLFNTPVLNGSQVTLEVAKSIKEIPGTSGYNGWYVQNDATAIEGLKSAAGNLIESVTNKNKFMFPFFVRCGLRLSTDEVITISPPCLMEPSTGVVPELHITHHGETPDHEYNGDLEVQAQADCASLYYCIRDTAKMQELIDSGNVRSLVIAITRPIMRYKQGVSDADYGKKTYIVGSGGLYNGRGYFYNEVRENNYGPKILLPSVQNVDTKTYEEQLLESLGDFHIIKEIELASLPNDHYWHKVVLAQGELAGLEANMKLLPDDTGSLDKYDCNNMFSYNLREHRIGVTEELFSGFDLDAMSGYCLVGSLATEKTTNAKISIKTDDGVKEIVRGARTEWSSNRRWLFFPFSEVSEATIYDREVTGYTSEDWEEILFGWAMPNGWTRSSDDGYTRSFFNPINEDAIASFESFIAQCECGVTLKKVGKIKGWYHYQGYDSIVEDTNLHVNDARQTAVIDGDNMMHITADGNPASISQRLRVGDGELLAAASNTKPISRGQAGVAPLFVFATDGVWAIKVGDDGTYSVLQPLSRDVLINKDGVYNIDSITPIDNAVLYITDRGIMAATDADRGSFCLSDNIFSNDVFDMRKLDGLASVLDEDKSITLTSFRQFISEAKMLYDYTHQRIICYNSERDYAYVYSLKSKNWGMVKSNILYGVNSYPDCWAVGETDEGNKIIDLSVMGKQSSAAAEITEGVLITRPLKLDEPDVLKTVDTIIQRGKFNKGHVQTILYGSRDLFNWHLVSSSVDHILRGFRGTPYKYFRIVLLTKLEKGESVYGCTIQYTPRLIDKIR